MVIRLAVNGATGRMGQRVCALADAADDVEIVCTAHRDSDSNSTANRLDEIDLIIDFSTDQGVLQAVQWCRDTGAALLVATTGLSAQTATAVRSCANHSPVMIAPNTSRGVAVLAHLVTQAAALLHGTGDVDVIESHHAAKRDQPSGTALRLVEALQAGGEAVDPHRVHCIRAGGIVGEHCVQFSDQGEILRLSHSAISRDLFASGALEAGRWLVQQAPGMHDIAQAWGLPTSSALT